jgi:SAM-dependent methyltransferase
VTDSPDGPRRAWFNELAAFLGTAYLRNAFTKGTEQEVDFLVDALELRPGMRVLDAGCGPGRHALALARRGIDVVGVDLSDDFIALAREQAAGMDHAAFLVVDVRDLAFDREFDAVICLCQGGFGLLGGGEDEDRALAGLAGALRPGGRLALSAFNAYFAARHLESGETFDAATGVNHETATLRDPDGNERGFDLWTTCFTPRELRLLAHAAGLTVDAVYGVSPGQYATTPPSIDRHEHLLLAHRAFDIA